MKSLFPALLLCLSTLAVAHQEQEPPALDLVRLQQEVTQEVGPVLRLWPMHWRTYVSLISASW